MSNLAYRCRCRWTDRQKPDRLTEQQTDTQMYGATNDRLADRQTDGQQRADWLTDRRIDQQRTRLADRQTDGQQRVDWLTDRRIDQQMTRLADRQTDKERNMTCRKKYDLSGQCSIQG